MSRQEEIFHSFINHPLIRDEYGVTESNLPNSLEEGIYSEIPIIRSIAMIVQSLENETLTDKALKDRITQYLNTAAI